MPTKDKAKAAAVVAPNLLAVSGYPLTDDVESERSEYLKTLRSVLRSNSVRVGVVGLGYVGLPLAMAMAESGAMVTGFDVDVERIESLNAGRSVIDDVDDATLQRALDNGKFEATSDFELMGEQHVLFVCVPTPITSTKDPDLSYLRRAAETIAAHLRPGQLIVVESTTYPGTTEEVVKPLLEERGFRVGRDVFLAFSPERIDPGNQHFSVRETPKVIGGCTPACSELAAEIYSRTIERDKIHIVSSPATAEMTKLLENIFRSVNIALVNELALLCGRMGIDVWEVIEAAATKPFGFMPFYPGPGVGGHCIPVDPYYLSWKARQFDFHTRFIELAAEVNSYMPVHVVHRVFEALNSVGKSVKGAKVLVLGVTFKRDVSDYRNSPVLTIMERLLRAGADVLYSDPYVPKLDLPLAGGEGNNGPWNGEFIAPRVAGQHGASVGDAVNGSAWPEVATASDTSVDLVANFAWNREPGVVQLQHTALTPELLQECDCVVIGVDHKAFDFAQVGEYAQLVVDTRNAMRHVPAKGVVWGL